MTQANEIQAAMDELAQLLEAYGADQARWPVARRGRVEAVLATEPRAMAMLAEGAAFDRLLDQAVRVSPERAQALALRIVAHSNKSAADVARSAEVVAFKRVKARLPIAVYRATAASLAASLLLGVFVGSSGVGRTGLGYLSEAVGLSDDWPEVATGDTVSGSDDVL